MAEKSLFFDSTENDERLYSSADFAQFMKLFYSTGVVQGGDRLKVTKNTEKLAVSVLPGEAVVDGRPYWLTEQAKELAVPAASTSFARIDRVVLRLDLSTEVRSITAQILQGEATASPQPPKLLRNNNYYDISLAQLYIPANALQVETVTDERYDAELCGICQGLYTLDMSDFEDLNQFLGPFTEHIEDGDIHVTKKEKEAWNGKAEKSDHQLKTYTDLSQIGLKVGSETIEEICEALPNASMLTYSVGSPNNGSIYPKFSSGTTQYGLIEVVRRELTRVVMRYVPKVESQTQKPVEYIGMAYQDMGEWHWSGWSADAPSVNGFTFAVADKEPTSAPAGRITFVYEE